MKIACEECNVLIGAISATSSVVAALVSIWACRASNKAHREICEIRRRYSSGNVQIVDKALCHERLERAAEILSEALKCQDYGADEIKNALLHLYNCEGAKYHILSDVFRDLEHVCALIHDNAIPPSIEKSVRNEFRNYLSRAQIYCFVNAYKETYPMLSVLAEETREKWN